ncbi:peptidoglycan-binding domain-containing protein [Mucilaginibacter sp.]|uniref:C40 family peptidase n=1 Tax=Mucilaginibacter sp. TaxID=1882438 RepID=UPI002BBA7544|nr:peptidoglycan-binding domain-containing protein [Mucilaginibacter sp.]HTI57491.1 peptidoglycan-binding domain-containing protein [Mucilaginibacter sp.]
MTGDDIILLGDKHVGEPYQLGVHVPKDDGNYKGPWDCTEFVSWLYYQVFGLLYGCENNQGDPHTYETYSSQWARDANTLGRIITVEEAKATPGAAIIRFAGNGDVGHIAVSDGNGGTVEAHGKADGITNSVVDGRRWDMGVLVPGVNYKPNPVIPYTPPSIIIYRLMHPYMVSPDVGKIQAALNHRGFDTDGVDNIFGECTFNAVKLFQDSVGLNPDGEVSALTAAALEVSLK